MPKPTWRSEDLACEGIDALRERVDHERILASHPRTPEGRLATGKDAELVLALPECREDLGRRRAALVWTRKSWGLRSVVLRNHPQRWDLTPWRWRRDCLEPAPSTPGSWDGVELSPELEALLDGDPRPLTGFSHWGCRQGLEVVAPWSRWLRWRLDHMDPGRLQAAWEQENARRNREERKKPLERESLRICGLPGQTTASKASLVLRSGPRLEVEWTSVNDRLAEALWALPHPAPLPRPPRLSAKARKLLRLLETPEHREQGLELAGIHPALGEAILERGVAVSRPGLGGLVGGCGLDGETSVRLARVLPSWRERVRDGAFRDLEDLAELEGLRGALLSVGEATCSRPVTLDWLDVEVAGTGLDWLGSVRGLRWLRLALRGAKPRRLVLPEIEWLSVSGPALEELELEAPRLRTLCLHGRRLRKVAWPGSLERVHLRASHELRAPAGVLVSEAASAPLWSQQLGLHG